MAQPASGTGVNTGITSITRKGIGDLLRNYEHKEHAPIDCFFFQIQYPFKHLLIQAAGEKEFEKTKNEISKIAEQFFLTEETPKECGTWYNVINGWTLTYFLDAERDRKSRQSKHWFDFEDVLNKKVCIPLREKFKIKYQSHRVPIVFMRACKYTIDDAEPMDLD